MVASGVIHSRYRLVDHIGRGGVGLVWKGVDELLERDVAVKIVDLDSAADPAARARFERELRATARLAHPSIVTIFDGGIEGATAFLVMELLPGPTLAQRLHDVGPLPVDEVVRHGIDVASGLGSAHAAGIIHRDLKPANLMMTADRTVKILDFGIAWLLDATAAQQHLTATTAVVGTAAYSSPEQLVGGPVDARSDLYGLGCTLFGLLTGHPPYLGPTALEVASQHVLAPVPSVDAFRSDVPTELVRLLQDLLAKDPDDRPSGAQSVADRLASCPTRRRPVPPSVAPLPGLPPTDVLPVTAFEAGRRRRRGPLVAAGAAVVAVAGVVTVAAVVGTNSRAPSHPPGRSPGVAAASSRPPGGSGPSVTTTPPTTIPTAASTAPTTGPATTPATTAPPTTAPSAAAEVAALGDAVAQAADSGDLSAGAAGGVENQVNAIRQAVEGGDPGTVAPLLADLSSRLTDLVRQGELTSQGYSAIAGPLQALQALYPETASAGTSAPSTSPPHRHAHDG
jgi:serine/threonine-protein kinase